MSVIRIGYEPREHQHIMHDGLESHRWSVVVAHRRFGKTVAVINHIIKMALTCQKERPRYAYIAPLYSQAKTVAWDYLKHFTSKIPGVKRNESELWVELPNSARIRLFGADRPDTLRGIYLDGVVLDEVAQMKMVAWEEVIRPALSDRKGWAVFIGTPKGLNMLHDLFIRAQSEEDWYAGFFPANETNVIDPDELETAKASMSENSFRQEFFCDFLANLENTLIGYELVEPALGRTIPERTFINAPNYLGVDVARFGDNKSVIFRRQGLMSWIEHVEHRGDTMSFAEHVAFLEDKFETDATFVDAGGIGGAVIDRLRQLGRDPIDVHFGGRPEEMDRYVNKRAEIWCRMRDWLKIGGCLPKDERLLKEMTTLTYDVDVRDRIALEKKSEAVLRMGPGGSPDLPDALACTFAYHIPKKDEYLEAGYFQHSVTEYDINNGV